MPTSTAAPYIPSIDTNALTVDAATLGLPAVVGTISAQGRYLNAATAREPVAVLGATAARWLGFDRSGPVSGSAVAAAVWFYVSGHPRPGRPRAGNQLLDPGRLPRRGAVPGLGRASLADLRPRRSDDEVRSRGCPARPPRPTRKILSQVNVSQPSQALTAQAAAAGAFDTLLLGLGAVALLVGAVGVANIMVISLLERRQEIGLRRALRRDQADSPHSVPGRGDPLLPPWPAGPPALTAGAAATADYARAGGVGDRHPPQA